MYKDKDLLETLINGYEEYKRSQVANSVLMYDAEAQYKGQFKVASKPYQPLRVVQIYFDTATCDENVKDVSVTLADQFGAIRGTMGLFAGFSFLSALEIVYYLIKAFLFVAKKKFNPT